MLVELSAVNVLHLWGDPLDESLDVLLGGGVDAGSSTLLIGDVSAALDVGST